MIKKLKYIAMAIFVITILLSTTLKAETTINKLTDKEKNIVLISSYTIKGEVEQLHSVFTEALEKGVSVNEIKEILVQMSAYAGFPRSLNAITVLQNIIEKRESDGILDLQGSTPNTLPTGTDRNKYGEGVRTQLTGTSLKGSYAKFIPVIDDFLKEHLFADIFSRGVLTNQEREISTISALSSVEGLEAQLCGHLKIGLNIGLLPEQLQDIISLVGIKSSYAVLQDILEKGVSVNEIKNNKKITNIRSQTSMNDHKKQQVIKQSELAPYTGAEEFFTGSVNVQPIFTDNDEMPVSAAYVTFQAGARTAWHVHPTGQRLIVTDGIGRTGEMDGKIHEFKAGDTIICPAGVKHWHGAAPHSSMTHIAITGVKDGQAVEWLEKVTDEQYNGNKS